VVPYNGGPRSRAIFETDVLARRYPLVVLGWDVDLLARERPPYVIVSEFEYREELRLCGEPADATRVSRAPVRYQQFAGFWNRLHERYELLGTYGGWRTPKWLAPATHVPHDWMYPMPETRVYRRR
jgi:hypothetical protein